MADVVLNHCSVKVHGSLVTKTETHCMKIFCTVPEDFDISNIVRPEALL